MIFEFNDAQILFGMFQGFKKTRPIWRRQKVEVDSTPSAPWKSDMLAFSMALGYGHVVALMMMASLVPMMPEKSTNSTYQDEIKLT